MSIHVVLVKMKMFLEKHDVAFLLLPILFSYIWTLNSLLTLLFVSSPSISLLLLPCVVLSIPWRHLPCQSSANTAETLPCQMRSLLPAKLLSQSSFHPFYPPATSKSSSSCLRAPIWSSFNMNSSLIPNPDHCSSPAHVALDSLR